MKCVSPFVEVRYNILHPDANEYAYAYAGTRIYTINWQRMRASSLSGGRVPCAREGCTGLTDAVRWGIEYGGVVQVVTLVY